MAQGKKQLSGKTVAVFFGVFAFWEVLDRLSKTYFEATYSLGTGDAGPLPRLFNWVLVHNTGGAWGMFSDSTAALGVFSLVISFALLVFALWFNEGATVVETVSLALVVAGGFGNAVDRFAFGYVIDFINAAFMDFPVFNVADIGVTCGMIVFFFALLIRTWKEEREAKRKPALEPSDTKAE